MPIVLQPSRPARGEEPTVQNDPVIHRTDFEQAWSTQVDYRPQASALLGAGRDAVGSLLGLQFRTTRFGTNSGSLDPYSLKRAKNTV